MKHGLPWLCALAAVFISACNNNPTPAPWKKTRPDGSPWITAVRAFPDDPRSLDPQFTYDEYSHRIVSSVYESLLSYEPFRNDFVLTPELGSEVPQAVTNPDGTIDYICRIKKGVRFADDPCFPDGKGRELTSADFVFVFQRIADPKVESPLSSTLQEYLYGMADAWAAAQKVGSFDYAAPFVPVQAIDRYTFRIRLKKPYPQIKYWLAFPFTAPVPREAIAYYDGKVHDGVQREQFKFHPVGTGAFRLVEWSRGRLIRLVRNDSFYGRFPTSGWPTKHADRYIPHVGKQLPLVDEVQFLVMRESIPAWILFKQGWTDGSGVGKDIFNSVMGTSRELTPEYKARGIELEKDIELGNFYLNFNMQDPLVGKNTDLRRALSTVFDTAKANRIFFNGTFIDAKQLLPPGIYGYDPNIVNPYRDTNVARARELLAKAGYPGGIDPKTGHPLELIYDSIADDSASRQLVEYEKNEFEKLGIRVRIVENSYPQMQDKQDRGAFQFTTGGWNADYPDPENFFFLFYGPNAPPSGYNQSRYDNPEFNKLFVQMSTMDNSPERAAIIAKMNRILIDDCVIVPLYYSVRYVLMQPWAKRIVLNALVAKGNAAKYIWVDQPVREIERKKLNRRNYWPLAAGLGIIALAVWVGIRKRAASNV
jgi:oligopeptide transport system substrate-binding protein